MEQFLYLLRIPAGLRVRLKQMQGVTQGELRPMMTEMDPAGMRTAVGRLLGMGMMAKKAGRAGRGHLLT